LDVIKKVVVHLYRAEFTGVLAAVGGAVEVAAVLVVGLAVAEVLLEVVVLVAAGNKFKIFWFCLEQDF
jgi:hypothetical protein